MTREDREAAVAVVFGEEWRTDSAYQDAAKADNEAFIAGTKSNPYLYAGAAAIARSVSALREAAERLCAAYETHDGMAYCGGANGPCGECHLCGFHDALNTLNGPARALRSALTSTSGAAVEPDPEAPLDVAALPDYWDARRERLGKPDKSTCAAELRRALEHGGGRG